MDLYAYPYIQIVEDVMREMNESSTETHIEARYKRIVDDVARFDIPAEREWDWLRSKGSIVLTARYNTGTLSATNGSATLTGSGTTWATGHSDMLIKISGDNQIYTFTFVSTTSGTISPAYYGDTDSGLSYEIIQNKYSLPVDWLKFPTDRAVMYYYRDGSRIECSQENDREFRKKFTYQPGDYPRKWRMYPGRTNLGRFQIELSNPVKAAQQLEVEYTRKLHTMFEINDVAAASCTTTKVLTDNNLYGSIEVGQYISVDPTVFGGSREWTQITAVAADTTTGSGITVDTLRAAFAEDGVLTVCDAPDMIETIQRAIFFGACAVTAAEKSDPALKAYLLAYEKVLSLDKSRLSRRLYGRRYLNRS